jgi:hypothetical protein
MLQSTAMRRRLLNGLSILGAIMSAALVGLWAASYWRALSLGIGRRGALIGQGTIVAWYDQNTSNNDIRRGVRLLAPGHVALYLPDSRRYGRFDKPTPPVLHVIWFPAWAAALLVALVPASWLMYQGEQRRRRGRLASGRCAMCGQALPAGAMRCPNCGNVIHVNPSPERDR